MKEKITSINTYRAKPFIKEHGIIDFGEMAHMRHKEYLVDGSRNILIVRTDDEFVVKTFTKNNSFLQNTQAQKVLYDAYKVFVADAFLAINQAHSEDKKPFEIHVFDSKKLEVDLHRLSHNVCIINLDPMVEDRDNMVSLETSRGYTTSGEKYIGQVARPGSASLDSQIDRLHISGQHVILEDDDTYTANTIAKIVKKLQVANSEVDEVRVGVQIGQPDALTSLGIPVTSPVTYKGINGVVVADFVDYLDPRDTLVGVSGLVVQIPDGNFTGRAAYLFPFTNPHIRTSIPEGKEQSYSRAILEANSKFYQRIEDELGLKLSLQYVEPAAATYLHEVFGFPMDMSMKDIITFSQKHMEAMWKQVSQLTDTGQNQRRKDIIPV